VPSANFAIKLNPNRIFLSAIPKNKKRKRKRNSLKQIILLKLNQSASADPSTPSTNIVSGADTHSISIFIRPRKIKGISSTTQEVEGSKYILEPAVLV
jgi:hypothetical protein